MLCETLSNAGLTSGLWDGLMAAFTLLADLFFETEMYDRCHDSWLYQLGFVSGFLLMGQVTLRYTHWFLLLLLVAWMISIILGTIWGVVAILVLTLILLTISAHRRTPN